MHGGPVDSRTDPTMSRVSADEVSHLRRGEWFKNHQKHISVDCGLRCNPGSGLAGSGNQIAGNQMHCGSGELAFLGTAENLRTTKGTKVHKRETLVSSLS